MSDHIMNVEEAQMWVAQDKSTRPTPRAARMIVAQAEQIERLQGAVQQMMIDLTYAEKIVHDAHTPIRRWEEPSLERDYDLLPGDMEAPGQ